MIKLLDDFIERGETANAHATNISHPLWLKRTWKRYSELFKYNLVSVKIQEKATGIVSTHEGKINDFSKASHFELHTNRTQ